MLSEWPTPGPPSTSNPLPGKDGDPRVSPFLPGQNTFSGRLVTDWSRSAGYVQDMVNDPWKSKVMAAAKENNMGNLIKRKHMGDGL